VEVANTSADRLVPYRKSVTEQWATSGTQTPWPCWPSPPPLSSGGGCRSKIAAALRRGGRQRRADERAVEVQAALRSEQLAAPALISKAMGASVKAHVAVIAKVSTQVAALEAELSSHFELHPDVKVVLSLPGHETVPGRVLAEFGDAP
jgi:hypothetical protein